MVKVKGFRFAGINCGLKKSNKKDLGLILSDEKCIAHAVFTKNKVIAAPLEVGKEILRFDELFGVIANSGNANACTGNKGVIATNKILNSLSKATGYQSYNFFPSSTGIIGVQLDYGKINNGISKLVKSLNQNNFKDFAESIRTTDKYIKYKHVQVRIGKHKGNILGIAKGAGMIHPGMATMLCFLITDLKFNKNTFKKLINNAVDSSFNCISVDGDMSTNDTVLALSNGMADNKMIDNKSAGLGKVTKEIQGIFDSLAEDIVRDGEGSTKICRVVVKGARDKKSADFIARQISTSLLFKTALYGSDPNWGRIIASVGSTQINYIKPNKIDIHIGKIKIVKNGELYGNLSSAKKLMKKKSIEITINLNKGKSQAFMLTNDIGHDYIKLNSLYTT
tara:strand:- start:76 stop:1257 length:1182 start_codon:yes stop_codon:yes gene_type:complete